MNIKEILLFESGIRIPKGTKAAKIIHHEDLDGVFSAMLAYRQIVKQGIKPRDIYFHGIQYGDNPKQIEKNLSTSGKQMTALVDFARLPEKQKRPDFWSDHHEAPEGIPLSSKGARIGAKEKKTVIEKKDGVSIRKRVDIEDKPYKSDSEHLSISHAQGLAPAETIKAISMVDSAGYKNLKDVLLIPKDFKKKGRMERLAIIVNALLAESGIIKKQNLLENFIKNTQPSLPSMYNNLLKMTRLSKIQEQAISELGKDSPDWELVNKARKMMPSLKSAQDIVSKKIKSRARIKEIEKKEFPVFKHIIRHGNKIFVKYNGKEYLARMTSNRIVPVDKEQFFKDQANLEEGAIENVERMEYLKNKKNKTKEEEQELKDLKNSEILNIRDRRKKSVEKHRNLGKDLRKPDKPVSISGYRPIGSVVHQVGKGMQRFIWTQLHQNGLRYPFTMKSFGSTVQISVNPDLPESAKNKINLVKVAKDILKEVKKEFPERSKELEEIEKLSGGHAGIANIAGLHLLKKQLSKEEKEEMWKIKEYKDRIKKFSSIGARKLDPIQKEKLQKMRILIRRVEKLGRYSKEEEKILRKADENYKKFQETGKMEDYLNDTLYKALAIIEKQKKPTMKFNKNFTQMFTVKKDTKVLPGEVDMYERAKQIEKVLSASFSKIMPNKAARLKELNAKQEEGGSYKSIVNLIKQKLQDKLDEIAKTLPKLKGSDPRFKMYYKDIKEEIKEKAMQ